MALSRYMGEFKESPRPKCFAAADIIHLIESGHRDVADEMIKWSNTPAYSLVEDGEITPRLRRGLRLAAPRVRLQVAPPQLAPPPRGVRRPQRRLRLHPGEDGALDRGRRKADRRAGRGDRGCGVSVRDLMGDFERGIGTNKECEWCGAPAGWEICAHWRSFWSCSEHDVAMVQDCADRGVYIHEIIDRR